MLAKTYVDSPIGTFEISGTELGVQSIRRYEGEVQHSSLLPQAVVHAAQQLHEYFLGQRQSFDIEIDWGGATEFNKAVWAALLEIPFGRTTSYSFIAEKIGNPTAVRAVGLANRNNPIAIIVPCHRVIAKNGNLHGYFYGLEAKRFLLQLENPVSFATQGKLF